jgi:hypothetical protein
LVSSAEFEEGVPRGVQFGAVPVIGKTVSLRVEPLREMV